MLRFLMISVGLCFFGGSATAADEAAMLRNWPGWRGPLANGVAPEANPPNEWSETKNVRWKIELPGKGHSGPIVFGDRVFVTAAVPVGEKLPPVFDNAPGVHDSVPVTQRHEFTVMAFDRANGKLVWRKVAKEAFPHEGGHYTGSLASNSPVTDGEVLIVSFGSRGLYCYDLKGELIWQKNLGRMQTHHSHGEGSSPVIYKDWVIVCWDNEGDSFLYAFDKRTGKERWKTRRDEKTSWATPIIVEVEGKAQILTSATRRVRGNDLETGADIWEASGLAQNAVASPVAYQGVAIFGNSYDFQAMLAVKLAGAKGNVNGTKQIIWKLNRSTPYVPSPLLYGDTLYFLRHNQNVLSRLDPMTGEFRDSSIRLDGIRDFIFASPVGGGGRIYITGRDGMTVVLQHDRKNEPLAVNKLGDSFSASAALAGREIFLRGERYLYCVAEAEGK